MIIKNQRGDVLIDSHGIILKTYIDDEKKIYWVLANTVHETVKARSDLKDICDR